ncbi:hypothetical protein MBLNU459_g3756t1 [Dothideomycetes sp. NU459]
MFGNYSVATASRHPSSLPCNDDYETFDAPPVDARCVAQNTFARQLSITQLSQRFSEQRLHQDTPFSIRSNPFASSCDASSDADFSEPLSPRSYVGSMAPSKRRTRRQEGVRMLCDPAHLRSIQEMVDRMIQTEDQCAVVSSRAMSLGGESLPTSEDDEGYNSLEDASTRSNSSSSSCGLSYRRSADMSVTGACISKNVRQRRTRNRSFPSKA